MIRYHGQSNVTGYIVGCHLSKFHCYNSKNFSRFYIHSCARTDKIVDHTPSFSAGQETQKRNVLTIEEGLRLCSREKNSDKCSTMLEDLLFMIDMYEAKICQRIKMETALHVWISNIALCTEGQCMQHYDL